MDDEAVDELYKGRMPNFLSEANPDDRLRFYEVNFVSFSYSLCCFKINFQYMCFLSFALRTQFVNFFLCVFQVQEQDICENDWLRLYTDFALYCYWQYNEVNIMRIMMMIGIIYLLQFLKLFFLPGRIQVLLAFRDQQDTCGNL